MFNPIKKTVASNFNAKGSQGSLGVPIYHTDATGKRKRGTWDEAVKAQREAHSMKNTAIRTGASNSAKSWLDR